MDGVPSTVLVEETKLIDDHGNATGSSSVFGTQFLLVWLSTVLTLLGLRSLESEFCNNTSIIRL